MRILIRSCVTLGALVSTSSALAQAPLADERIAQFEESYEPAFRGAFRIGMPVVRRVPIVSRATKPIGLRVVGTSCPCTTARLQQDVLLPGESVILELMTTAADVSGRQQYTAEIEAKEQSVGGEPVRSQRLSTNLAYSPDLSIVVSPRQVVCVVGIGDTKSIDLHIRRADGRALDIERVVVLGDWVLERSLKYDELRPSQATLRLDVRPEQCGTYRGTVEVHGKAAGEQGVVQLVVAVEGEVRADPAGIVFVETSERTIDVQIIELVVPSGRHGSDFHLDVSRPTPAGLDISRVTSGVDVRTHLRVTADWSRMGEESGVVDVSCTVDGQRTIGKFPIVWLTRADRRVGPEGTRTSLTRD